MYTGLLLKKKLYIIKQLCCWASTKIWSSKTVFNINNKELFFKQQINILKLFMKDQITLKTRILLFKITMISILVFTILNVFFYLYG